jgi:hypothetical protein
MMDPKKPNSLDDVISSGAAHSSSAVSPAGDQNTKSKKIRTLISIDEALLARIDRHIIGNRSAWLAKVATEYLDSNKLE